jgi:hypothetical protein
MNIEKTSLENEIQPSFLGAVISFKNYDLWNEYQYTNLK